MWQSSRQKVNNETLHRIYVEKDFKKSVNLQSKIVDLMCSWIKNSWNGNFIMAEISFHFTWLINTLMKDWFNKSLKIFFNY